MKTSAFIIFLSVVLTVYSLINFYIFIRGWQAIPSNSAFRKIYLIIFLFLVLSYIIGRVLERFWVSPVSEAFIWIGSFWLSAILYFVLIIIILDFTRLLNETTQFYPSFATFNYAGTKIIIFVFSVVMVSGLLFYGYINARTPKLTELKLSVNKKAGLIKDLNIVVASDIHLGTIVGNEIFGHIVERINSLNPDLILLAGDIVDEDLGPVIRNNIGEHLLNLKSKYGVFGITGNHEYIGGAEAACNYLAEHGITMLRDTAVFVNESFYIAGREDKDIERFSGKKRKSLDKILTGADRSFPIIVMNHQPTEFDEAVKAGTDLHLSGHTHHGQMWPLTYITDFVYELSVGYLKKSGTHFYVSSGAGTWGPPVRIGTTPEIVNIKLKFE